MQRAQAKTPIQHIGLPLRSRGVVVRHAPGKIAIDDISVSIEPGEQVALIGPSGAGKTTLLSVLSASRKPDEGTICLADTDPWDLGSRQLRALRGQLFVAPQSPPLPPRQRVVTAVTAGLLPQWSWHRALTSLWRADQAQLAWQALEKFSLGDKLWSRVDRLSGGERQRVSLARALVSEAKILFVDEPLSALDPALAGQTLKALVTHARQGGATLVCSLHQVDLALENFPRLIGLRDGRLVFDAPTANVTREAVRQLYFGREAASDGANIHPLHPGPEALASSAATPGRCA